MRVEEGGREKEREGRFPCLTNEDTEAQLSCAISSTVQWQSWNSSPEVVTQFTVYTMIILVEFCLEVLICFRITYLWL